MNASEETFRPARAPARATMWQVLACAIGRYEYCEETLRDFFARIHLVPGAAGIENRLQDLSRNKFFEFKDNGHRNAAWCVAVKSGDRKAESRGKQPVVSAFGFPLLMETVDDSRSHKSESDCFTTPNPDKPEPNRW